MRLKNPAYYTQLKLSASGKKNALRFTPEYVEIPTLKSEYDTAPHKPSVSLLPKQKSIIDDVVNYTSGLLIADTGYGKSFIIIAAHQARGGKSVVACHSLTVAKEIADKFNAYAPDIKVSFYCDGKKQLTGDVVITTHTTLRLHPELFKEDFDNLFIDEADLMFESNKSRNAILALATSKKYILGLTGTANTVYDEYNKTKNGVLAEFYGRVIHAKDDKENVLKGIFYRKYKKVYMEHGVVIAPHSNWIKFNELLKADLDRKKAQLQYILETSNDSEHILVLFNRVDDVYTFYEALKKRGYKTYMQTGEMNKKERIKHLNEFEKTGGYMVGVTTTLSRGYDNKHITKAYILFPINAKKENALVQLIGRVVRVFDGKQAYIYDWVDSQLEFQFKRRLKVYQKRDVIIKEI